MALKGSANFGPRGSTALGFGGHAHRAFPPTNGQTKLYLGFENVRMRYTNYLWIEAVAVVPTTEYYRTKYTID